MRYLAIVAILIVFLVQAVFAAAGPTIAIQNPKQNQLLNTSTVFISVLTNSKSNISYKLDGSAFDFLGQNTTSASTSVNTSEGSHVLTVRATDFSGPSTATVNFSVDITPPTISLNSPENSSHYHPKT